jgi:hypothetical protein
MRAIGILCGCCCFFSTLAQDYSSFTGTIQKLYQLKSPEVINQAWNDLVESENIPMIYKDSVAFLYRGEARSVVWMGDFNGWGYTKNFDNKGKRIPGTDIWILKTIFPIAFIFLMAINQISRIR